MLLKYIFLSAVFLISLAQAQQVVSVVPVRKGVEGEDLKIRIEFSNPRNISSVKLFYRAVGEETSLQVEIEVETGGFATVTIPGSKVRAPGVEIMVEIVRRDRERVYFPGKSPDEFMLIPVAASEKSQRIIILSPEEGSSVKVDELTVSASLISLPENLNIELIQVLFDNVDVTKLSVISPELVIFVPENVGFKVKPGRHTVTIILKDSSARIVERTSWSFTVLAPAEVAERERALNYRANFEVELRQESVQRSSAFYGRGRANLNGSYTMFNFNTNIYLTTEERNTIQPQHRFFFGGEFLDWVKIGFGDVYPSFSPLILSGYRVRGLYGKLDLRYFQIEVVNGETRRGIEGKVLREISIDSVSGPLPQNSIYDSTKKKVFVYDYGTYKRNLFAIKPSLKFKKNFELALIYLVSQDDKFSIKYGGNPQKNVVLGSSFLLSLDQSRFELKAQGAFSIRNENLRAKSWTDADIDSIFKDTPDLRDKLKKYRSLIEKFVPLNQYITPINPLGLSSLAYEVGLNLNYFGNFFKVDYIYHGSDYLSFGQPYLRYDIQGFKVFDRLRLFKNQVFLTFRYENLNDNTKKQRDFTTRFVNWEVSTMFSPLANLPTLTLAYGRSSSNNGLPFNDTTRALNLMISRFSFDVGYYFEYIFKNRVNLTFSINNTDDKTIMNSDFLNTSVSFSIFSDIKDNLRGNFLFALNNSKFYKPVFDTARKFSGTIEQKFNYVSLGVGAEYLFSKIRVFANVSFSVGDLKRLYLLFGESYEFARNQSLNLNANYLFYPERVDIIAYLTYKYAF